ncbi:WD40 repeat domain-containing serine/threonine protein kinase [Nannocystis bainbridge]|uniref:Serine/threonine-protein kinase n=1 Tax=Nannocystis bainbridge TaxID=2995303 RepID=A0ABT5DPS1_9BACT|nr:serine/threonine-protein kinase [Nannocystis bainbridge]MDC0715598.1 serine/threonine-protein kinase [Nannocystis bainbridge]
MTHSLAEHVIKIEDVDATHPSGSTAAASLTHETLLSPGIRPDVLAAPEHLHAKRAVAAAIFGAEPEAVQLGRYRLLNRVGAGGMGIVYAAYDDRLDRKLALKLIRPKLHGSASGASRILREARALARLSHPHVVHVYEVGELADQRIFVAMEFLAGPTLRAWLDGERRPWPQVLAVFRQAGEGLAAAHAQGVVHRDFKPHNAIFGADGRVRVLDFGLAQFEGSEEAGESTEPAGGREPSRSLTSTGAVLGTPAYMAPEQFAAKRGDARTDQFSFCIALYEALYGHRPFAGETLAELTDAVSSGRVSPPPKSAAVPAWVHAALLRGLQSDPERRWPTMNALLAALAGDPAARWRTRRRWTSVSMVAAGLLTGGAWWAGEQVRRADAEERAELDREVAIARAEATRQAHASALAHARGSLAEAPLATLQALAELEALDPREALEARTLALAALSRGLPDRVLRGPEAEVLTVLPAAQSPWIFAQDGAGDMWRWGDERDQGQRIARLGAPAAPLVVAPSGQAWVAAHADALIGAHAFAGEWQQWRTAWHDDRRASAIDRLMITTDEAWLVRPLPATAWDLRTGREIADAFPPAPASDPQNRALVTPDARFLARGKFGADTVSIWDRTTGEARTVTAHGGLDHFLGVSSDGQFLYGTSTRDGEARAIAWDLARATAHEWRGDVGMIRGLGSLVGLVQRSSDGLVLCATQPLAAECAWRRPLVQGDDRVLVGGEGYAVESAAQQQVRRPLDLGELATGAVLRRFHAPADYDYGQLDHAGRYLARRGPAIDVWEPRDAAHTIVDLRRGLANTSTLHSPAAKFLIRHHKPTGALTRIDTRAGTSQPLAPCLTAGEGGVSIVVDETGRALVSHGGKLDLYAAGSDQPRAIAGVVEPVLRVFLAPDGRGFAAIAVDGTVYAWSDPDTSPRSFEGGDGGWRTLMYDPGGARLASLSSTGGVQVFADGALTQVMAPVSPKVNLNMDMSGDGRWLVALELGSGRLVVHDLVARTTRPLDVALGLRAEGYFGLRVSHDGQRIAVSDGERLFLVDAATAAVRSIDAGGNIWSMQFDPGGELLFGAVGDTMQVWELESMTATPMWTTKGFARLLQLGPDGELVAREDGEVHRFALGLVPRSPAELQAWLRAQVARLTP